MVAFDVFGGRRTSLPQQIAGWRRPRSARGLAVLPAADYPTSVSLNRLAYECRGLSDVCQPQSSRIRIWTQGRARRCVGKSGLGTRSRARGTTLMLESAGGEPLHRLNLPTHGDRKTAWR